VAARADTGTPCLFSIFIRDLLSVLNIHPRMEKEGRPEKLSNINADEY